MNHAQEDMPGGGWLDGVLDADPYLINECLNAST